MKPYKFAIITGATVNLVFSLLTKNFHGAIGWAAALMFATSI